MNLVLSAVSLQPFFLNSLLFAKQTLFGLVKVNVFRTIGKNSNPSLHNPWVVVATFNHKKALVGAYSVIVQTLRTFFSSSTEKGRICVSYE